MDTFSPDNRVNNNSRNRLKLAVQSLAMLLYVSPSDFIIYICWHSLSLECHSDMRVDSDRYPIVFGLSTTNATLRIRDWGTCYHGNRFRNEKAPQLNSNHRPRIPFHARLGSHPVKLTNIKTTLTTIPCCCYSGIVSVTLLTTSVYTCERDCLKRKVIGIII